MFQHHIKLLVASTLVLTLILPKIVEAGTAIHPDATGDFITVPDSPSLSPTSQITLEAWVRISSHRDRTVIGKHQGDSGPDGRSYLLSITPTGQVSAFISHTGSGSGPLATSSGSIALGRWQHVAATFDGTTLRVYRNGVEEGNATSSGSIYDSILLVRLGFFSSLNQSFDGEIDEVRIWNVARTQTQIQVASHQILTGNETGLQGYWKFDNQDITDSTPNGNNGSISGNPTWTTPGFETIAYWPFDEGSGGTATDISGNGHDATLSGAQWTTGISGAGVEVSASSGSYLSATGSPDFGFTPSLSFTIEGWAYADSSYTGDVYGLVVGHWNNAGSTWGLNSKAGLGHNFRLNGYGRVKEVQTATSNHRGVWAHVAVVYDASTGLLRMYSNGQLSQVLTDGSLSGQVVGGDAVQIPAGAPLGTSGDLFFGKAEPLFNHHFTGKLDDVRISRVALSPSEFLTATVTTSLPNTTANYLSTVEVPINVSNTTNLGIVATEFLISYDTRFVESPVFEFTGFTPSLTQVGWSAEENIFPGSGDTDTLSVAMSTAIDTLSGAGVLGYVKLNTKDIRHPLTTPLEFIKVLFNDGNPGAATVDGSVTFVGADGTVSAQPDSIIPGDTITITVTDIDEDRDTTSVDAIQVLAFSKTYNDSQSVTLNETGIKTGVFTGSLLTQFTASAQPSQNGTIGTIAQDSICVEYVDSLSAAGTTITRIDAVEVIGGQDGQITASYVVQALDGRNGLRDTVRVQVTDSDLDLDVGNPDQVSVTVTNNISSETETLTLIETGASTGIFQVRVPTISGASGTNNDGELSLASEDTLYATYVDALTSQGGSSPIQSVTQVVNVFGDVRSNNLVQAFDSASILAHAVGLNTYTARDSLLADVDGNNQVQAFDAANVLQYVVRLIDSFPVRIDNTLNPPADPKNHPFLKPAPLHHIIALGELSSQNDGTFLMPVSVTDRQGILSATLEIGHSDHIQILDVITDVAYDGFMITHNPQTNKVRVAFAGAQTQLSGSGSLMYLHIKATGELQFSLDHVVLNGHTLTPTTPLEVITQAEPTTPLVYALHQNHPNPFNPETMIRYDLPEASEVRIVIYNVVGQQIRTLITEHQSAGAHQIIWNAKDARGRDVSSGVYFLRMESGSFTQIRKMLLLR